MRMARPGCPIPSYGRSNSLQEAHDDRTIPEALRLRHLVLGYRLSRCIAVAAELGIADLLADGPRLIDDIAAAVSADAAALYRVMRLLASEGIFSEVRPRCFALTPLAEPLRADHPSSLRKRTLFYMAPPCWGSTASGLVAISGY
jgi:hypothetical protein